MMSTSWLSWERCRSRWRPTFITLTRSAGCRGEGWRSEVEQRAYHLNQISDGAVVLDEGPSVVSRELRYLGGGLIYILPVEQGASVRERHEVGRIERVDLVAEPSQAQLSNDGWPEQADHVGEDRDVVPGPNLLGHGRTADPGSGFEHDHPFPGPSQVGGADQSIVTAADNDRVVGGWPRGPGPEPAQLEAVTGRPALSSSAALVRGPANLAPPVRNQSRRRRGQHRGRERVQQPRAPEGQFQS